MKSLILLLLLSVFFVGTSSAAVEFHQDGTKVNKSDKVNFKNGPAVTANGTVTDVDFDNIVIAPVAKTSNPCATLGNGSIFWNSTSGYPCYCDGSTDKSIYSASLRCF